MKRTSTFDDHACTECHKNGVDKAGVTRFQWFRVDDNELQCPTCESSRRDVFADYSQWDLYGICGAVPGVDFSFDVSVHCYYRVDRATGEKWYVTPEDVKDLNPGDKIPWKAASGMTISEAFLIPGALDSTQCGTATWLEVEAELVKYTEDHCRSVYPIRGENTVAPTGEQYPTFCAGAWVAEGYTPPIFPTAARACEEYRRGIANLAPAMSTATLYWRRKPSIKYHGDGPAIGYTVYSRWLVSDKPILPQPETKEQRYARIMNGAFTESEMETQVNKVFATKTTDEALGAIADVMRGSGLKNPEKYIKTHSTTHGPGDLERVRKLLDFKPGSALDRVTRSVVKTAKDTADPTESETKGFGLVPLAQEMSREESLGRDGVGLVCGPYNRAFDDK